MNFVSLWILLITATPLSGLYSTAGALPINSTKLNSLSYSFSCSPNNISGSTPIQHRNAFADASDENSYIRLYCVDNALIHGFSINSRKLSTLSHCCYSSPNNISGCCDDFTTPFNDNFTVRLYCVDNPPVVGLSELRSLSHCFSCSPNNIYISPPIQCSDDFLASFTDNSAIDLYCVDNPPIIGFSINSMKLRSLASGYQELKEKEGHSSLSLESQWSGSTRRRYYGWFVCAALVWYFIECRDYRPIRRTRLPQLIEQAIDGHLSDDEDENDDDDDDDDDHDDDDYVPHFIPIWRLIGNVDDLVATVDIAGCVGFTSFALAVRISYPGGGNIGWIGCVLWPWRGDLMQYMTEDGHLLDPLRITWIEFSEQLSFIRITPLEEDEPTIGLLFNPVPIGNVLEFDDHLPTRYANTSTAFATALHYAWATWSGNEPHQFDVLEDINIAPDMLIRYFSVDNVLLLPPPLLPLPADMGVWVPFITSLSYITMLDM